jgi:hypothetical protein
MFATLDRVRTELSALAEHDAAGGLSGDAAVRALGELGRIRRVVDALVVLASARVEADEAHRGRGDRCAADTTATALGTSRYESQEFLAAAKLAEQHPPLGTALRAGQISPRAVVQIGATLQHAPDALDELLLSAIRHPRELRDACLRARAQAEDPDERARRQRATRSLGTWTDIDGLYCGRFRLTPEIGAQIKALLDAGIGRRLRAARAADTPEPIQAYAADELAELILGPTHHNTDTNQTDTIVARDDRADTDTTATDPDVAADDLVGEHRADTDMAADDLEGDEVVSDEMVSDEMVSDEMVPAGEVCPTCWRANHARWQEQKRRPLPNLHIVIDHGALVRGIVLAGERCEIPGVGPVNVQWARSLLGEAFLTAIIANGVDIHTVAHFGRHINATLRTALLVQGRECDIAGCGARGYLEIDHEHDHADHNPTALVNLGWLCAHHHRLKTAGWRLGPRHPSTRKRNLDPPLNRAA